MKISRTLCALSFVLATAAVSQARDWYFDKDSLGGKCSDTGTGDIAHPFCSPFSKLWNQRWNEPAAGDTIYLRAGTYTGRQFWINGNYNTLSNGTPENPITIRSYPGEKVVFDGQTSPGVVGDMMMFVYGAIHDLHFLGPFEARNYAKGVFDSSDYTMKDGLSFDNWDVHNVSMGWMFRGVSRLRMANIACTDIIGTPTSVGDNVLCIGVKGVTYVTNDDVRIENVTVTNVNDGRGGDNGDGDGIWTDQGVNRITIRNVVVDRVSEDGVDTKAQRPTLENVRVSNAGATGVKVWGSQGWFGGPRTDSPSLRNVLSYRNVETGIKCSGAGDLVLATLDNVTTWNNGQNGFKNTRGGIETAGGCTMTIRNSISGGISSSSVGGTAPVQIDVPASGLSVSTSFDHVNLYPAAGLKAINVGGCSPISGKYTAAQYISGAYNLDASGTYSCGGSYGTFSGTSTGAVSASPGFRALEENPEWYQMSDAYIASDTVKLATEATYTWPNPIVGHYVEVGDDGVRRRITAVGDATNRTVTFSPPVSAPIYGRATDGRGVRLLGWASGTPTASDFRPAASSPAVDAGVFVPGVHCAKPDGQGGSSLTGCVHWTGAAPDLGYHEFGLMSPPPNPRTSP